jgi:exosortase/archaeosortase family protein
MRRTLTFAGLFIVLVGTMLIGYQYARSTELNHRYLFLVGKHTAMMIDWLVHSASVEGAAAYTKPPGEARAELAAWREQGILNPEPAKEAEDPETADGGDATDAEPEEPPLTPYERYAYRTLGYARLVAQEEALLQSLVTPLPSPVEVDSPEDHLALVRERFDRLRGAVERSLMKPGDIKARLPMRTRTWSLGPEPVVSALPGLEQQFKRLKQDPPESKAAFTEQLENLEAAIAALEQQQVRFLTMRLRQQRETFLTSGPYVNLRIKPAPNDIIPELTRQLNTLLNEQGPMTADRAKAIARTEADLNRQKRIRAHWEREDSDVPSREPWVFAFVVVPSCGAFEVMAIFIAAVAAFPCAIWKRLAGLALGIPLLYALNIGRLACLGIIGGLDRDNRIFDFAHEVVWQGIFVIFVVVVYMVWVILLVRKPARNESD